MLQFQLSKAQSSIIRALRTGGIKVWTVGGSIRDRLSNREPKDLDFAHNGQNGDIVRIADQYNISIADDQKAWEHGIVRLGDGKALVDFACLRKDTNCDGRHAKVEFTQSIEEDLARRDFTINAMAAEIDEEGHCGPIIDPFGGQGDLTDGRIKFVGDPLLRIKEDFLRILRACRFTALGEDWHIYGDDTVACKKHAIDVMRCSKERIHDEFVKALMYPKPSRFFRTMENIGLLQLVFPDLARGVGDKQNSHHNFDTVFDHLLRCLDASVEFTDNPMLRLATLTHDIAKPHTKKIINGDATFHKHEVVGATIMYEWMKTYKFSRKECEYVSKMVRNHQFRFEDNTTDKSLRHWLADVGPEWRDLITLRMADRAGNVTKKDKPLVTQKMKELIDRVEDMIKAGIPLFKEDLAINGDDLIKMGIRPGPIFKEIFSNMLGIVITHPEKNTRDWLTAFVEKNYVTKNKAKTEEKVISSDTRTEGNNEPHGTTGQEPTKREL